MSPEIIPCTCKFDTERVPKSAGELKASTSDQLTVSQSPRRQSREDSETEDDTGNQGEIRESSPSVVSAIPAYKPIDLSSSYADTSEPEEFMDSFRNGVMPSEATHSRTERGSFRKGPEDDSESEGRYYLTQASSASQQLSIKGRTALRKYFDTNVPMELPRGQLTIAFSKEQIHSVLRTISDETVISSFHMMKSFMFWAVQGKVTAKNQSRTLSRRAGTPGP